MATAAQITGFKTFLPEFGGVDDDLLGSYIDEASDIYSVRAKGTYLLAAHIYVTSTAGDSTSPASLTSGQPRPLNEFQSVVAGATLFTFDGVGVVMDHDVTSDSDVTYEQIAAELQRALRAAYQRSSSPQAFQSLSVSYVDSPDDRDKRFVITAPSADTRYVMPDHADGSMAGLMAFSSGSSPAPVAAQANTRSQISREDGGQGASTVISHRVGQQETRYAQTASGRSSDISSDNMSDYFRTEYGRRYLRYYRQTLSVAIV